MHRAFWCTAACATLLLAPDAGRAQAVVTRDRLVIVDGADGPQNTLLLRGDTLRWIVPGAPLRRKNGSAGATTDTVVILFARDSVYELRGARRVPADPLMARHYRQLRDISETERMLRAAGVDPAASR